MIRHSTHKCSGSRKWGIPGRSGKGIKWEPQWKILGGLTPADSFYIPPRARHRNGCHQAEATLEEGSAVPRMAVHVQEILEQPDSD